MSGRSGSENICQRIIGEIMNGKGRTVSLVLGSGGARGLAHIGVIHVLEKIGFEIRSISGSSMGALIGGVYAAGKLDVYTQWVCGLERLDMIRLLDFSFSGSGIFKGERVINKLRTLIGDCKIEDLPIAYTAVATDLKNGKEVWLDRGPLFDAIRASIAFPTIFAPFHYNGRNLVDGGLLNPLPIAPTLRDRTDLTIAVSLSGKAQGCEVNAVPQIADQENGNKYYLPIRKFIDGLPKRNQKVATAEVGFFEVISMILDTMETSIAQFKLADNRPDILIEIPKDSCNMYEFERAKELIGIGRLKAEEALGNGIVIGQIEEM